MPWLVKNPSIIAPVNPQRIEVYFIKALDRTFYQEVCKSLASGLWFTNFPHVFPTSRVAYYARKQSERFNKPRKYSGKKMKVLRDDFIFNGFQLTSWSLNRHGNTFKTSERLWTKKHGTEYKECKLTANIKRKRMNETRSSTSS